MARTVLEVTAVGAIQLPDIEVMRGFGVKMDSYLALQLGSSTAKTKKAYGGGRNPNWQEVLHLEVQPGTNDLYLSVRKYSKISAHDEIARGIVNLPAWEQQGGKCWEQRVTLQPARAGKGPALGGEVLLKLQYTTLQEASSSSSGVTWPSATLDGSSQSSSLPPLPAQYSGGDQALQLSAAGASASLSRLMNKLQKPRKSRASSDAVPVPGLPLETADAGSNGENPMGHSPRQFSLQKALDKVLKKVGAKEKDRPSSAGEGGYATAEESETASRRSSIASLTEPPVALHEVPNAAPAESAHDRHRIMPGWPQVEQAPVLPTHASTSTQTDSPHTLAPASSIASSQPSREAPQESLSGARQSELALSPHASSLQSEPIFEDRASGLSTAHSSVSRGVQSSSEDLGAGPALPQHSTHAASFPTPPSPFAAVQEECILADATQSSGSMPPASSAEASTSAGSGIPSAGANTSAAAVGTAAVGASQSGEPATPALRDGRVRLEHLDTAYRRRQGSAQAGETHGSTSSDLNGHASASSSGAAASQAQSAIDEERSSDEMEQDRVQSSAAARPSSQAQPIRTAAIRGFVAVQPLGSPFADHSYMDRRIAGNGAAVNGGAATGGPSELLSSRSSRLTVCMADEEFQAGLKTMPQRIPALPDAIPGQENGCVSEDEHAETRVPEVDDAEVVHVGPLALQPRLSAAPEDEEDEHGESEALLLPQQQQEQPTAGRVMRKTLSRKSPFLPEVLQALNDYNDIVFCEEYGKKVLLGEGSFGEVYKASYLDCDIAVKKLNRINDAKSEEAFRQECAILKACRHPHIVNFMGVCKDEVGRICLMTELMDTSLMSALLLPDDANKEYHYYNQGRYILMCVAKALIYLHKHNIVHLDVKSANVLLKKGDAKLADVGLSLMLSKSFANSCSSMGTFSWAATELLLGSHPVTTASDIFSFGVLLWEVCTLEQPHLRHMRDIIEDEAPEAIRQLFFDCVREDPYSRPTAKQVLQVLMDN